MSESGQKQTSGEHNRMSALPQKANIDRLGLVTPYDAAKAARRAISALASSSDGRPMACRRAITARRLRRWASTSCPKPPERYPTAVPISDASLASVAAWVAADQGFSPTLRSARPARPHCGGCGADKTLKLFENSSERRAMGRNWRAVGLTGSENWSSVRRWQTNFQGRKPADEVKR